MASASTTMRKTVPERLSIDTTVLRDYVGLERPRHAAAVELFEMAARGDVELVVAPQGFRFDVTGPLAALVEKAFPVGDVRLARQLSYPSAETYPSPDLFPGNHVAGFAEAWREVASTWNTHEGTPPNDRDMWHVETHLAEGRDVFVTDDEPLLTMCRQLREEHGLSIVAMRLPEYLARSRESPR